jgi:hypothetical protein
MGTTTPQLILAQPPIMPRQDPPGVTALPEAAPAVPAIRLPVGDESRRFSSPAHAGNGALLRVTKQQLIIRIPHVIRS